MAKDLASIVMATTSFASMLNGENVSVRQGELFHPDDPIVRHWSEYFVPAKVRERHPAKVRERHGEVEQATAAPGEKRGA